MLVPRSLLARELKNLGLEQGDIVMIHCRMSALGCVIGGAETVVRALLDAVGQEGTLLAYTGWRDEPPDNLDDLDEESKHLYLEEHPAYDPRVSPARRDHGRIPEALRTWPGARHSGHPEAAVGLLAEALTTDHPYDDAYGMDTPYARLVEAGGKVIMLGASLDTVTLVHHAEAIADVSGKRRVSYCASVIQDGERVWRTFSDIDTSKGALPYEQVLGERDYVEHIAHAALAAGVGRSSKVGEATAYLFDAQRFMEQGACWIERNFRAQNSSGSD